MRAPTLRQLHSFVAAVETGSLSAAARSLHITQPAVSQQVKELERALATKLLRREGDTRRILLEEGAGVTEALRAIRGPLFGLYFGGLVCA